MKPEDLDPITTTKDGRTVWKRYDGGRPLATGPGEGPEQAPDGDAEPGGDADERGGFAPRKNSD